LLVTPRDSDGISRAMRVLGSRYAQCINRKYERSGTLWEGRHKAGAVDAESYLPACYRYIEINPVRAGLVALGPERIGAIRAAVHYCQPVGSTAFATTLARRAGQRPGQLARGRPRNDQRRLGSDN
jgi:putative transposase